MNECVGIATASNGTQCPFCREWQPEADTRHVCQPWGPRPQYAMPARLRRSGDLSVVCIKPFFSHCPCVSCGAWTLVDGTGEFECPGCGCHRSVQ